ncbi:MAG: terminase small subunit [Treponema sp.]|nr:terminase small subunit [Treponema sp.]
MKKYEKQLEPKQAAFCREYIKDCNATQAAVRAGYSPKTAQSQSARLLLKVMVQNEISKLIKQALELSLLVLKKQIFDKWYIRAFYNPADIITAGGALKYSLAELSEKGLAAAVEGVETKINPQGIETVKVKLADRDIALDMLAKYIQMIKPPTVEITGGIQLIKVDDFDIKALR